MAYEELKERSKAIWASGDYSHTSRQLEPASEHLVEAIAVAPGHRVLDIAAGDGNCAIAAAGLGASVIASDFSPVMIEAGRRRTPELGLDVEWRQADAADLPFEDDSFDRVTSVFGAIFAPEQRKAGAEAVRVVRPGGVIGFTSWTSDGYTAQVLGLMAKYGPPRPPDSPDPFWWGRGDEVEDMFRALGCEIEIRPRTLTFSYASFDQWRSQSESHGAAVMAKKTMDPDQYEEAFAEMTELAKAHNRGDDGRVLLDADYLELIVTKR